MASIICRLLGLTTNEDNRRDQDVLDAEKKQQHDYVGAGHGIEEGPYSGYKIVVKGTGGGYGELKEYVQEVAAVASPPIKSHGEPLPSARNDAPADVAASMVAEGKEIHHEGAGKGKHQEEAGGQAGSGSAVAQEHHETTHNQHQQTQHHGGAMQKIKSKVRKGLQKVKGKKKEEDTSNDGTSEEETSRSPSRPDAANVITTH